MKYLITGGTGLVGSKLIQTLLADGHEIHNLSRSRQNAANSLLHHHQWDGRSIPASVPEVEAVINLAGATIGKRWTKAYKVQVYNSRIHATQACLNYIQTASQPPKVFISASGYNYYGNEFSQKMDETAPSGSGFMPELCKDWEAAAQGSTARTVTLRTAVVLDGKAGPLAKMVTPYRFFIGGPTGTGKQGFPWIHLEDMVRAIRFILDTQAISGPVNMVVPQHGTMQNLANAIGKALSRPSFFRLPKGILNLIFGEMAVLLWGGGFVKPAVLEKHSFSWKFPELDQALANLLSKK
ncbi:MAG TPA: TIGR01777 family protein [Bacteroidetes bacterium]|nr:TIGR01777 family protein [Bacteroidota bacterium]